MGGSCQVYRLAAALAGAAYCLSGAAANSLSEEWRARASAKLQAVYDANEASTTHPASAALGNSLIASRAARLDERGRVQADAHYNCASSAPTADLRAAGLSIGNLVHLPPLCAAEGWIDPASLPKLSAIASVTRVTLPSYVRHIPHPTHRSTAASSGTTRIDSNGVSIMRADQFVSQAGGGGGGVVVGVQSEGIATLSTIQGRQELPAVNVLTAAAGGSNSPSADEGTVLLEEVHAVAPNAGLAFCEPQTFVEYTACLGQFVGVGATVAVDDILFLDQDPLSANGTDSQALETFITQNPKVMVFTAVGNDNGSYYEGSYTPVPVASAGLSPLTCTGSAQVDNYIHQFASSQILTITPTSPISVPVTLAWADSPGQNVSHLDLYWTNQTTPSASGCLSSSTATDPIISQSITLYPGNNIIRIATPDASANGKFLKLWVGGDGLTALSVATAGSIVSPQSFAAGAIPVGAVNGADGTGNSIEKFSGRGPITVAFPASARIQAPALVAPDGINVDATGTFFASDLFPDGNFYGTSAAAPNAAAVAALIRGAFPDLTPAQVLSALEKGAAQLGAAPPDGTFGYGRIDAIGALDTFPSPTITSLPDLTIDASSSTTSSAITFTVSGTGTIHFTATSTNTALVPGSIASTNAPGVAITPANCGSSTLACSLTVTAAPYEGGTATITVSAVDGAGRAAPATLHVTVNNPKSAPSPPTAGSKGGGGSIDPLAVICLWLPTLLRVALRHRRSFPRARFNFFSTHFCRRISGPVSVAKVRSCRRRRNCASLGE